MEIEICTVGGYNEVGKNMTAIRIDDEVIICDMGIYLPAIINYEEEDYHTLSTDQLINLGAIPDDSVIKDWKNKVKAIVLGHCHLDHIASIPYLAAKYRAPIIGSPFTIEVLKSILRDDEVNLPNKLKVLNLNSKIKISDNITIELINITHSTLQAAMIAIHTPKGIILYACDFKFDNNPIMGDKPNYKRLKELGKDGVLCLISESLYSANDMKTPSEAVARDLLKDVMLGTNNKGRAIFITSFASHIARIKSVVEFSKKLNRKVLFLGRSMSKYIKAAENLHLINFSKEGKISGFRKQSEKFLKLVEKNRGDYAIICTGSQGEPGSILDKIINGGLDFKFNDEDHVIFSCKVIPTDINKANRKVLEDKLKARRVRIFKDVHVSVLPDTEVVVNDENSMRIKKIEDIKEDSVRTASFDPKTLKVKWLDAKLIKHDYNGKIFKITTKSGRSVDITSGHSLFILNQNQIKSIKGDLLKIGDYIAIPRKFQWIKVLNDIDIMKYIDVSESKFCQFENDDDWIYYSKKKISKRRISLNENFARVLGYYLAEGSAPRHISLVFGKHEGEVIKECITRIKKVFPSNINKIDRKNSTEIQFGANILKRIFKKWFGDNAKNKRIPDFVFSADEKFKLNFLGAYINGDGSLDKNKKHTRIRIKTASKKLASDLLYLFAQVGICAKFDGKYINKPRRISNNKNETKETICYIIRIQGRNSLKELNPYLSNKFKEGINEFLNKRKYAYVTYAPEALPIKHIDLNEIKTRDWGHISDIKKYYTKYKNPPGHISYNAIKREALELNGNLKKIIGGDLLFDPVTKIEVSDYEGKVYDFKVPSAENFLGGFGGIFLHNSGHASREDLRDFIEIVNPKNIIPAHGEASMISSLAELAEEEGYKTGVNVFVMRNGQKIIF